MKSLFRTMVILLSFTILFSLASASAEQMSDFDNGVSWNMSPEEVLSLEPATFYDRASFSNNVEKLVFHDAQISKYYISKSYFFINGKLKFIIYQNFAGNTNFYSDRDRADEANNYLTTALTSIYGDPSNLEDTETAKSIELGGGDISKYSFKNSHAWENERTRIWIFTYEVDSYLTDIYDTRLIYLEKTFDWGLDNNNLNTTGL